MNWQTVEEVPRADAKERQPRSGSARALPFVWDFAYGGPAGNRSQECSALALFRRPFMIIVIAYWNS